MALGASVATGGSYAAEEEKWDKTFLRSDKVTVEKVTFKNRINLSVVGDLYSNISLCISQSQSISKRPLPQC